MVNTVDDYWDVGGTSLHTYAYNIETLSGRISVPSLRGEDEEIPHRPGTRWLPKVPDSRTIQLAMWVIGANPDGSIDRARRDIFDDNVRSLQALFWTPGRQISLRKRFRIGGAMRSATALAEYESGLEPEMIGRYGAKFVVNLRLADPYFYDDVPQTNTLVNGNQDVTALGNTLTQNINITILGARRIPRVRNTTQDIQFTYNDELLVGESIEVDVKDYRAIVYPSAGAAYRAGGTMIHAGAPHWFELKPGVNQINVSSTTGTGTIVMVHRGAWL